ncbi:4'-phosphopantetheinyl transferase family protein [Zhenhengia yiwuensis]|uniref:4'-phosphopantetheinyl transferase superfamily protein n=1 Tax=Zhenhengia yiwuensis TaxID=2763666 RepID=A0A926EGK9_9FIRM|nr:4'-phosphopantetheinyl transferase superfamily protein [Zhenhengia yiwuensis]MBC8580766.1 4'-phosphopantetheinyl transferase superfamily protein [Zhenhengia yiwuensis]
MIIINCINITDINNDSYQLLRNAVSEERRIRADHFHFMDDAKRCVCAELLLQYSLFQEFGRLVEMEIIYNKFGKPFLNHTKGFSYNISHSGKWVVIAYGSSEVGIDIERIQIVKENIVDRFFAEEEKIFIHEGTGNEQKERFTQIWTLKESYIKYLGTGLSTRLNSFSVNVLDGMVTNQNGDIQNNLRIKSYLFDKDYYISVCSRDEEVTIHEIKLEDLIQFINSSV